MGDDGTLTAWLVRTPSGLIILGIVAIALWEVFKLIGRFIRWLTPKLLSRAGMGAVSFGLKPFVKGLVIYDLCREIKQPERIVAYLVYAACNVLLGLVLAMCFMFGAALVAFEDPPRDSWFVVVLVLLSFLSCLSLARDFITFYGAAVGCFGKQVREAKEKTKTANKAVNEFTKWIIKYPGALPVEVVDKEDDAGD